MRKDRLLSALKKLESMKYKSMSEDRLLSALKELESVKEGWEIFDDARI